MTIGSTRNVLFALVVTCACGAEPRPSEEAEREMASTPAPEAESETETEPAPDRATEVEAGAEPSAGAVDELAPAVFTRISFDLRGMPHFGPQNVRLDQVELRLRGLMDRTRDAAGDPEPRLTYQRGSSVFRAEFFGAEAEALAQCRRAVQEVAPPEDPASGSRRRRPSSSPRATPCAVIETD